MLGQGWQCKGTIVCTLTDHPPTHFNSLARSRISHHLSKSRLDYHLCHSASPTSCRSVCILSLSVHQHSPAASGALTGVPRIIGRSARASIGQSTHKSVDQSAHKSLGGIRDCAVPSHRLDRTDRQDGEGTSAAPRRPGRGQEAQGPLPSALGVSIIEAVMF